MSSASAPILVPQPAVQPSGQPSKRSPRRIGVLLLVVAVIAAGAYYWATHRQAPATESSLAAIRTATAYKGALYQTIRLTGTTGAKEYAMLITPSLRGSRSDGRRDAKLPTSGVQPNITVRSNNTGQSSSASSATNSPTSSTTGSTTGDSSSASSNLNSTANNSSSSLSSALQSSTSRVGSVGGKASSRNITSSADPVSASSSSSLGSTASSLVGSGGGGGGGGNDFGLVLQKLVPAGTRVKPGDVVAEFDRQNMLNRLDDYQASVAQTQAAVNKMKAELAVGRKAHDQEVATAKADVDKAQLDLKAAPVLGAMDTERLKLALEEAEARYKELIAETKFVEIGYNASLRNAEMDLQQANIELKRAQANADRMLIKAPIAGLTVMQQTFRGSEFSLIQEGDQLWPGQPFMQVVNTSTLIVNATVNQVDVERIRIGQAAKIRFDAYPGLEVMGHVYAVAAITRAGGMRGNFVKEVPVQIRLDQMDPRIIPDLSVSADVIVGSDDQAASIVPLSAVFPDDAGDGHVVYVKKGNDWEKRRVELGLSNYVAIALKSGLSAGEEVAIIDRPHKPEKKDL